MKEIKMTCDGCGFELANRSLNANGVYKITHESCVGESIWGDNRIDDPLDFCKSCFDLFYKHLPTKSN